MHWSCPPLQADGGGGVSSQKPLAPLVALTRAPEAGLAAAAWHLDNLSLDAFLKGQTPLPPGGHSWPSLQPVSRSLHALPVLEPLSASQWPPAQQLPGEPQILPLPAGVKCNGFSSTEAPRGLCP